jgi:hypothetical protein
MEILGTTGTSNQPLTTKIIEESEKLIVYEDGTDMYVCTAALGSSPSAAVWRIKHIDSSSGIVVSWCDSNSNYDNTAKDLITVKNHSYG